MSSSPPYSHAARPLLLGLAVSLCLVAGSAWAEDPKGTSETRTTPAESSEPFPRFTEHVVLSDQRFWFNGVAGVISDRNGNWVVNTQVNLREIKNRPCVRVGVLFGSQGRAWADRVQLTERGCLDAPIAASPDGQWLAVRFNEGFQSSASSDSGKTWTPTSNRRLEEAMQGVCAGCDIGERVLKEQNGVWLFAWTALRNPESTPRAEHTYEFYVSRSTDIGESWSDPVRLAVLPRGYAQTSLALTPSLPGHWLVVLKRDESVWRTTSSDGGFVWSEPGLVHSGQPGSSTGKNSVAANCDPAGGCVLILDQYDEAEDPGLFARTSYDGGVTWQKPVKIAEIYDRLPSGHWGPDANPVLETDGENRWMTVWTASSNPTSDIRHRPVAFYSISDDSGMSWTTPERVVPGPAEIGRSYLHMGGLAYGGGGSWMVSYLEQWPTRLHILIAGSQCGDGKVDPGEHCDDGNEIVGDGCETNCTLSSQCGNSFVGPTEECDDADDDTGDECLPDCTWARCGDGYLFRDVEECDDGNSNDLDDCTTACLATRCGDGVVQDHEACDDGNVEYGDSCLPYCIPARCGDGVVWLGHEECDDYNKSSNDACIWPDCRKATCGDGFRWFGVERCDPADPNLDIPCDETCSLAQYCGDANFDGQRTASDALAVLHCAVSAPDPIACPHATCDLDGDENIRARDALLSLRWSVGEAVAGNCPRHVWLNVGLDEDAGPLNALQVEIDAQQQPIAFGAEDGMGLCESLLGDTPFAFSAEGERKLKTAIVSLVPFLGPRDLFRCRFEAYGPFDLSQIDVRIVDSATSQEHLNLDVRFD